VLPNFFLASVADLQDRQLDAFALPLVRFSAVRAQQEFDMGPAIRGKARSNAGEHLVAGRAHRPV
jgi:hypothetical protein